MRISENTNAQKPLGNQNSSIDSEIKALEKQKKQILKEISNIRKNDKKEDNEKTKKLIEEKMRALEEIDSKISTLRNKKRSEKSQQAEKK